MDNDEEEMARIAEKKRELEGPPLPCYDDIIDQLPPRYDSI